MRYVNIEVYNFISTMRYVNIYNFISHDLMVDIKFYLVCEHSSNFISSMRLYMNIDK